MSKTYIITLVITREGFEEEIRRNSYDEETANTLSRIISCIVNNTISKYKVEREVYERIANQVAFVVFERKWYIVNWHRDTKIISLHFERRFERYEEI